MTGRLLLSEEPLLHRCHAAVDEQQAGVVLRDEREAVQTQVALALKEGKVLEHGVDVMQYLDIAMTSKEMQEKRLELEKAL